MEVRLIGYGDRTQAGTVHQGIVPLLELAIAAGGGRSRVLAVVPLDFARDRASAGISLDSGGRALVLPRDEVTRLLDWVDSGGGDHAPIVIVCGDEHEVGRVCAVLGRMPIELVRAARPAQAYAALRRSPSLAVIAGAAPGLDRFVPAARAAGVPLLAIGCDDEPSLAGADAVTRLPALDERRLIAAVGELLDFV